MHTAAVTGPAAILPPPEAAARGTAAKPEAWLGAIRSLPPLGAAEELALARRYRDSRDAAACEKLVLANVRFVVQVARGYLGYGLPLADLVQEGTVGLVKSLRRYDPEAGVRLISFAVYWIKAEIHEYVLRNWRIVRVATTKAQRKLFFNLRRLQTGGGWMNPAQQEAMAQQLEVPAEEVRRMESRLRGHDLSLTAHEAGDGADFAPDTDLADEHDAIAEVEDAQWRGGLRQQLHQALRSLDARSQDIVRRRCLTDGPPARLEQLAAEYGVSAERIRQIQNRALVLMRANVQSFASPTKGST